jgi:DNA topoisomerase-3
MVPYFVSRQSAAVDARTELDLRIGAAFTRFQTLRLQPRFPELAEMVISYGACPPRLLPLAVG